MGHFFAGEQMATVPLCNRCKVQPSHHHLDLCGPCTIEALLVEEHHVPAEQAAEMMRHKQAFKFVVKGVMHNNLRAAALAILTWCQEDGWSQTFGGFEVWETGGGCKAYGRTYANDNYTMITDEGGADLPTPSSILVGTYPPDGDALEVVKCTGLDHLRATLKDHLERFA